MSNYACVAQAHRTYLRALRLWRYHHARGQHYWAKRYARKMQACEDLIGFSPRSFVDLFNQDGPYAKWTDVSYA